MSVKLILSIAAGGAIGAVSRYLIMVQIGHWIAGQFPWATLAVNVAGSFALGALVEALALVWSPSQEIRVLLVVGVLGSFTTFSTFSLDAYFLFERGELGWASVYIAATVVLSIGGFIAGLAVFRVLLS